MKRNSAQRPPVSRSKVLARLERAQADQVLVEITRWIPGADRIEGFVVGLSPEWVLLHTLSGRITLDGWSSVRMDDIQAVGIYPTEDCFEIAALKARGLWPPMAPADVMPQSIDELLAQAAIRAAVIAVHREFQRPDVAWFGAIQDVSADTLAFLEVNVAAGWARRSRRFDLDDITRIDFGGGYEEALHLVAGPPPPR